ncbi:hypothetical protein NIES2107_13980 [Nostoc carneum NIES-2107]|nr:hypothetical protein NIES2107_13980 [Nostoc carneum NIES-2107]
MPDILGLRKDYIEVSPSSKYLCYWVICYPTKTEGNPS